MPDKWFFTHELFEWLLKNKRGKMPKIVEPEQLPNIYKLKEENKDNANKE